MSWIQNGYAKWREVIVEHYGSLDKFEDASTIRVMLGIARREVKELNAFFDALGGRLQDDPIVQQIRADQTATYNAIHELLLWLDNRGLEE